jgi:phage gp45-like
MHRATPLGSSLRGFYSGGSASVVDQVDDTKLMQEMAGNFMANETRKGMQAPQNYGFTSVVFDAEKDAMGKIQAGAETFMSFLGGNRSYPVAGNMDDRRHRMYKLEKGDTAMFRGRGDKMQFHMPSDGAYLTVPQDKQARIQMLDEDSESNSTMGNGGGGGAGGGGASGFSATPYDSVSQGNGGGGDAAGAQQQQKGQESLYKKGQDVQRYIDVTPDASRISHKDEVHVLVGGTLLVHVVGGEVYLGAQKGKAQFGHVATDKGISVNVYAKIG